MMPIGRPIDSVLLPVTASRTMTMTPPAVRHLIDKDHELRRSLVEEMHVRRFPPIAAPLEMTQVVMFTADEEHSTLRRHAEDLCMLYGRPQPIRGRYFHAELGRLHFVWECHTEFSTYSFIRPGRIDRAFGHPVIQDLPPEWVRTLPGRTIRATQVALLDQSAATPSEELLAEYFDSSETVCAELMNGEAKIWSDFRMHDDGFGRLLAKDLSMKSPSDATRVLQRVQEIGNYRNMALLGFWEAQSADVELRAFERRFADLTREIAADSSTDDTLFHQLSALSANVVRLTTDTRYRMSATTAYAQIVTERLTGLDPQRVPGYQSLVDFTERRLMPAVRTCESFTKRIDDLSERLSWVSSLIRTRIDTTLSQKSTDLLDSMNRRTQMQLRLQQTVEGLSVLAISYYAIGILGYVLKPLAHLRPDVDATSVLGVVAPAIVLVVWYFIRQVRDVRTDA
jgi:uncharacterized membrane-anchored protein